jgi:hypothetical protein
MDTTLIKEHMKVFGSDGQHLGTVDCLKENKIILTKSDPASQGKHHAIPLVWVASVEDDAVRLNQTTEQVRTNWVDAETPDGQSDARAVCP